MVQVLRTCKRCNLQYPNEYFTRSIRSRNMKLTKRCYYCRIKLKQKKANHATLRACRDQWERFKKTHPCVDCHLENPKVIQADHVRGTKIMNCSEYVWWCTHGGAEAQRLELLKTEARCRFCHVLKSKGEWLALKQKSNATRNKKQTRELRHKEDKQAFVNKEKVRRGCCEQCNRKVTKETVEAFIFDHGNNWNMKNFTISNYINRNRCSLKRAKPLLVREMLLCQLLCANCDWESTRRHLWNHKAHNPHQQELQDRFLINGL